MDSVSYEDPVICATPECGQAATKFLILPGAYSGRWRLEQCDECIRSGREEGYPDYGTEPIERRG